MAHVKNPSTKNTTRAGWAFAQKVLKETVKKIGATGN
jgi:hypothetical protein